MENVTFKDDLILTKRKEPPDTFFFFFFGHGKKYVPMFKHVSYNQFTTVFPKWISKVRGIFSDLNGFEVFMFK